MPKLSQLNERQITHLIGAEPGVESYEVLFIAPGMFTIVVITGFKRKREEKQESQNSPPPEKVTCKDFRLAQIR